jgi:hypothetical protein
MCIHSILVFTFGNTTL